MAPTEQGTLSPDPLMEIARLTGTWIVAFVILVVAVGTSWTNGVRFGVFTAMWLVLTVPLMIRTARWLAEREHDH